MIKRFVIAAVLLALVAGGLIGFNLYRDRMIEDFFANRPVEALPVAVVDVRPGVWQPSIAAIGTVYASQGVNLSAEAGGIVREILFESNQQVEQGQVLVQLDDTVQRADLAAAETSLALERTNLARARQLGERGVTAAVNLETAQAAADAAEAQVARARALLEQRQIVAPFAGMIGLPRVDLGQFIQPGTIIATLQDLDTMRVDFSVTEQQMSSVFIGQHLALRVEGSDQQYEGHIVGRDPRVDPATRLLAVRGSVEAGGRLTPGQFVRITIDLDEEEGIVALPQTAVVTSLFGDYVYSVRADEDDPDLLRARQVFVEVGRRSGNLVEIRGGLEPGEKVVVAGQNRLSNNAPVVIDEDGVPESLPLLRVSL